MSDNEPPNVDDDKSVREWYRVEFDCTCGDELRIERMPPDPFLGVIHIDVFHRPDCAGVVREREL